MANGSHTISNYYKHAHLLLVQSGAVGIVLILTWMRSCLFLQILGSVRSAGKPKTGQSKDRGFTKQLQILDAEVNLTLKDLTQDKKLGIELLLALSSGHNFPRPLLCCCRKMELSSRLSSLGAYP